jgi:hypothetical protein
MVFKLFSTFILLLSFLSILIQFNYIQNLIQNIHIFKPILSGFVAIIWAIAFILSYFFSNKSKLLNKLMWICEHFSNPTSKNMAFLYSFILLIVGIMAIFKGISNM